MNQTEPRVIEAAEGETVIIRWACHDGTSHSESYVIPPKAVRERRAQNARELRSPRSWPWGTAIGGMKL